jgi:hypothetical protein
MQFLAPLIFASCAAVAAPALSDRVEIQELTGPKELRVIRGAGAREQSLAVGEILFVGDEVITAKGQIATLGAYDGLKWKVAPETRLKLEARKPEKQSFFYWVVRIASGSVWGQVPKSKDDKDSFRLKVVTKSAALGIRGTEYLLDGDEQRSRIDVLEGTVWWGPSPDFPPGSFRKISAGQHAELGADGKFSQGKSDPDKGALLASYRLGEPGAGAGKGDEGERRAGSPDECRALGKGWKSSNGSKEGECTNE